MGRMDNRALGWILFRGLRDQCRRFTGHLSWYRKNYMIGRIADEAQYNAYNQAKAFAMESMEKLRRTHGFSEDDGA